MQFVSFNTLPFITTTEQSLFTKTNILRPPKFRFKKELFMYTETLVTFGQKTRFELMLVIILAETSETGV